MSFDLLVGLERDLARYAEAEQISPAEAAVKFIKSGLRASERRKSRTEVVTDDQRSVLCW